MVDVKRAIRVAGSDSLNQHRRTPVSASKWIHGGGPRCGHAWNCIYLREYSTEQGGAARPKRVIRFGGSEFHGDELMCVKSERAMLQSLEILEHEASCGDEDQSQCGLCHNKAAQ